MVTVVRAQAPVASSGLTAVGRWQNQQLFMPTGSSFEVVTRRDLGWIGWCMGLVFVLSLPLSLGVSPALLCFVMRALGRERLSVPITLVLLIPGCLLAACGIPFLIMVVEPDLPTILRAWFGEQLSIPTITVGQLVGGVLAPSLGSLWLACDSRIARRWPVRILRIRFVAMGFLAAGALGSLLATDGPPTTLLMLPLLMSFYSMASLPRRKRSGEPDRELTARARAIASQWDLANDQVEVVRTGGSFKLFFGVAEPESWPTVGLLPAETDFVMASALARLLEDSGIWTSPGKAFAWGLASGAALASIRPILELGYELAAVAYTAIVGAILFAALRTERARRSAALRADARALRLFGDLDAAESAISKQWGGTRAVPSVEVRLANLRAAASGTSP